MTVIVATAGEEPGAKALAALLGLPFAPIEVHHFPDGEIKVRAPVVDGRALVYMSLDRPNQKLVILLLAAAALRDRGAKHLVLVAPYLGYMRQDIAFSPGEAVSQRVVGRFLGERFDEIVTIDAHLHRTPSLDQVFPGTVTHHLSATGLLGELLRHQAAAPLLIGPDAEAEQWVARVAAVAGLDFRVGEKQRDGDRKVRLTIPGLDAALGRRVVLVDDMVASGGTLIAAAMLALAAGATRVDALCVHALAGAADMAAMAAAGIASLASTESVPHISNQVAVAGLLAQAFTETPPLAAA